MVRVRDLIAGNSGCLSRARVRNFIAVGFITAAALISDPAAAGETMAWTGAIDDNFLKEFESRKNKISHLTLSSDGGSSDIAIHVSREIRRLAIETYVPASLSCQSACATVFVGGTKRTANKNSSFMFHAPAVREADWVPFFVLCGHYEDSLEFICDQQYEELLDRSRGLMNAWLLFLKEMGVRDDFLTRIRNMPHTEPWAVRGNFTEIAPLFLSGREAFDYKIATHLER